MSSYMTRTDPFRTSTRTTSCCSIEGRNGPSSFSRLTSGCPARPRPNRKMEHNIFTNRATAQNSEPAGVTIVLIDGINTNITAKHYARQKMIKYLKQHYPEDSNAIS